MAMTTSDDASELYNLIGITSRKNLPRILELIEQCKTAGHQ
jgi:hypothetical protein